jgi:uncharacterized protein YndB with AHSA1/START domain
MSDYEKTLRIETPAEVLYEALTDVRDLSEWWARATGSGQAGGTLKFFMGSPDPLVINVVAATRPTDVRWSVIECNFLQDWVGTQPTFAITSLGPEACALRFRHVGLTEELECIGMCSRGWEHALASLRSFVEVEHGMPYGSEEHANRHANLDSAKMT